MTGSPGISAAKSVPDPAVWRQGEIPEALLHTNTDRAGETVRFGGNVRLGDLNNDGKADLLVYRSVDGGMKVFFRCFQPGGRNNLSGEGNRISYKPRYIAIARAAATGSFFFASTNLRRACELQQAAKI